MKKNLGMSIIVPRLTYGSRLWNWNEEEQPKVWAVEITYLRAAAKGATRVERVRNEDI